ncbi:MAG TPA: macro domain-containing protein [Herpetosiphonaceae bacterium]
MKIILAAVEAPLAAAWRRICGDLPGVAVHEGSILDCPCEAVVSPANSFGFMDGGIDMLYSRFFGWHVQERLQRRISAAWHGELLVGQAEIVATDHERIPYLIAAPTMRVPMILRDSVNPYLACRAALLLARHGSFGDGPHAGQPLSAVIETIAFPGLGTGVGRVSPEICARQMRAAIEGVLVAAPPYPRTWDDAQARHQGLYRDQIRDLQYE